MNENFDNTANLLLEAALNAFDEEHGIYTPPETSISQDEPEQSNSDTDTSDIDTSEEESVFQKEPNKTVDTQLNSRFSGASWFDKVKKYTVTVAGLGGIGSWVVPHLARLDLKKLILIDDDTIDISNMSGQMYTYEDINRKKVIAAGSICSKYGNYHNYNCYTTRIESPDISIGLISRCLICGFDNMKARKDAFYGWYQYNKGISDSVFIDARLNAEEWQIFCIKGDDLIAQQEYMDKWLFSDEEGEETVCSYKQTSYCAAMVASYIVNLFINFVSNKVNTGTLPFMTSYYAPFMCFKTVEL